MSDAVLTERDGRVVRLTINRPDTRNALSTDVVSALVAALNSANDDPTLSCVVITGAGKGFSSGGNLAEIKAMTSEQNMSQEEIFQWYRTGIQQIPLTLERIDIVTIAAVHGHAIGAGCDLAAMCDLRIGAESASFAESFLRVGIIPGDGGAWFLPRIIGMARAKEMLLTAKPVKADRALAWGLLSQVVPDADLVDCAMTLAHEVACLPPQALRRGSQLIRDCATLSLDESLHRAAQFQAELQQLNDHHEAINATLEKREAEFTGN